jgi:hypothetical protein
LTPLKTPAVALTIAVVDRDNVTTAAYALGLIMAIGYTAAGIVGWIVDVTDGDGSDLAFWLIFLFGGAALVLAGLFATRRWSMASVVLVSVGAVAGAVALAWSILVPILALVLIALAILASRRPVATA